MPDFVRYGHIYSCLCEGNSIGLGNVASLHDDPVLTVIYSHLVVFSYSILCKDA